MARPFTPEMGRHRPRRPVHGAVHALTLTLVLVGSAWTGAHGGVGAVLALAGRVLLVVAAVWACLVLVAAVVLVLAVLVWVLVCEAPR